MHKTYQDGLKKLYLNSFESKEAKEEWLEFVNKLTPKELAIVKDVQWK